MTPPGTAEGHIFHLALRDEWEAAVAAGAPYAVSTLGVTLADQDFIHCSFAHQVETIAEMLYAGRDDVVLLTIDTQRLDAPVRVEGGFPHIYGPLPLAAVQSVDPFTPSASGTSS